MEEKDQIKLLSDNYFDATNTIRHYDMLRAAYSSLSVSGLAILTGFATDVAKNNGTPVAVRVLAIIGLSISLLSMIVVLKIDSLIRRQRLRARVSVELLEQHVKVGLIGRVDEQVEQHSRPWRMNGISLNALWISLFFVFFLVGLLGALFPQSLFH